MKIIFDLINFRYNASKVAELQRELDEVRSVLGSQQQLAMKASSQAKIRQVELEHAEKRFAKFEAAIETIAASLDGISSGTVNRVKRQLEQALNGDDIS